jgi:transporter family-2 protein
MNMSRLQAIATRYKVYFYLLLALASGTLLPIQANCNAQLARSLNSVPLAADISYIVGAIVLVALVVSGKFGQPAWSSLGNAPRWSLLGGVLGSWYISSSAHFTSVLGTTLTLGLVVGGQAIAGIVADHFGWLDLPQHRLTGNRCLAIGLLIVAIFFLAQPK